MVSTIWDTPVQLVWRQSGGQSTRGGRGIWGNQ